MKEGEKKGVKSKIEKEGNSVAFPLIFVIWQKHKIFIGAGVYTIVRKN